MAQGRGALAAALARHPNLDPRAVMAVAAQEGLGGGIGDQGTSFGPFQLHYGGAYPSFAPRGEQASQAWAWSPAGLDYALSQIARVAGGLRGREAVANIVSRFERPANIPREIAGALSAYGLPQTGGGYQPGGGITPGAPAPASMTAPRTPLMPVEQAETPGEFVGAVQGAISPTGQLRNPGALIAALQGMRR